MKTTFLLKAEKIGERQYLYNLKNKNKPLATEKI